jgi:signal transduction histidine kinase
METSGPSIAREAVGPLRRLVLGPSRVLPVPRWRFLWFGIPLAILALIGLSAANVEYLQDNRSISGWLTALLSAGAVLPVAIAVRRPVVAWRVAYPMLFLGTVYAGADESWPWTPVQIVCFLIVMLLLAAVEESAVTAWAVAFTIVVPFLYTDQANAFGIAVLFVVIALIGDMISRRRRAHRQLAEQAELTELERARRAILEERTRIAREMHDVVAHHMSMIAVQAETAPYRVPDLTEPAREELAGIAASARSALSDMRRLLGVLRADDEEALREPQPGLAELPTLVETARRAGMRVTYAGNDVGAVPEPVGLAAYRIAQEALANAARHAPGAEVHLSVRAVPGRLELTVHNGAPTGDAQAAPGHGHGLVGMRERAELLGGDLSAGPDGRGGYLVEITLPYAAEGPAE